ncbi:MAG: SpoIID/LytB domain-containing protein [Acidobacteriota bacterium]|nr:SpoIID/LytB domain-containing protein [Acidobacteriota bacterium]
MKFPYTSSSQSWHSLTHVCVIFCAAFYWWASPQWSWLSSPSRVAEQMTAMAEAVTTVGEEAIDEALQRAAATALDGRDGTIIVIDPQTGRVRAAVNAQLAFGEAFPPGSTIKPFTMLAALRNQIIDSDSSVLCREPYERAGFRIRCSHTPLKPPFDPTEALAHSCNYFFARIGERLDARTFDTTLSDYGFGARTGASSVEREAAGKLPVSPWRTSYALGEAKENLLVTPAQLITAYAALSNGGHLYTLQLSAPGDFHPRRRTQLGISEEHRRMLLDGMRGAVMYGSAARAGLNMQSLRIFGKTGTATARDDYRSHGWFVGFAADENASTNTERSRETEASTNSKLSVKTGVAQNVRPATVRLGVLVFLKRGQGVLSAEAARHVFDEYARTRVRRENAPTSITHDSPVRANAWPTSTLPPSPGTPPMSMASTPTSVRVRLAREGVTLRLPLEDYVFGVLAAEASTEVESEALEAQAIVSRTYGLKNLRRHQSEGYDFCNQTHCQRYLVVKNEGTRPEFYDALHRTIADTRDKILRDTDGRVAEVYFSTSCGGMIANVRTLWGRSASPPPYLRGARDEHCTTMPHHSWTDTIPAARLLKALQSDARTDVGATLTNIVVIKRDATGRAETLALEGTRRRVVRGWDFKIIVGRTLGWNILKSTRFETRRVGNDFVFRGSGFGHGLGLCQSGAHVMARRGATKRQILTQYFPGTRIGGGINQLTQLNSRWRVEALAELASTGSLTNAPRSDSSDSSPQFANISYHAANARRLTLASEHFVVSFGMKSATRREVETALSVLEDVRADVRRRLAAASVRFPTHIKAEEKIEVYVHDSTGDFVGAVGEPPWVAASVRGRRITSQPLGTLQRRGILATTLRHEYVHIVINALGDTRTPRWLSEGLAVYVAGESQMLARFQTSQHMSVDEIERRLAVPRSASEMRMLYAAAYSHVRDLIQAKGEEHVWRIVIGRHGATGNGSSERLKTASPIAA